MKKRLDLFKLIVSVLLMLNTWAIYGQCDLAFTDTGCNSNYLSWTFSGSVSTYDIIITYEDESYFNTVAGNSISTCVLSDMAVFPDPESYDICANPLEIEILPSHYRGCSIIARYNPSCDLFECDGQDYSVININYSRKVPDQCAPPSGSNAFATIISSDEKTSLEILEFEDSSIAITPNPCKDHITIKTAFAREESISIDLYNINGQKIEQITNRELVSEGIHELEHNIKHLPTGIYYCVLTTTSQRVSQKIVKL